MQLPPHQWRRMELPPGAVPAFIMELIMVRHGVETPATLTAREAAPPRGTMVREAPRDGEEAPLPGATDRAAPADGAGVPPRGAAATAARRDGGATRLRGAGDEIAADRRPRERSEFGGFFLGRLRSEDPCAPMARSASSAWACTLGSRAVGSPLIPTRAKARRSKCKCPSREQCRDNQRPG